MEFYITAATKTRSEERALMRAKEDEKIAMFHVKH
jgi:hypothetical protein